MGLLKLSVAQTNYWRLSKEHLIRRANKGAIPRVVSDCGGIQSQVLSAAESAIRARVEGITREDVREALWKDHSLIKTWCMRGTLHLLATSDLPTYVAALKTKLQGDQEWLTKHGVKPSEAQAITKEIGAVLNDTSIARENLVREVEGRTKLTEVARRQLRSAWGILLRPAAYEGLLAFGPGVGPKTTFFRPKASVGDWKEPSSREAFIDLFHRFIATYGPATIRDFAHWWGNLGNEQKSTLATSQRDLVEVQFGEHRGLMNRLDAEEAAASQTKHTVRLLPSFDCYVMFYGPRETFVPAAFRSRVFRQTAGWNYPTLVIGGFAAGIWSLRKGSKKAQVNIELFRKVTAFEKEGIMEEVADIGRFYGLSADVSFGRVT